MLIAGQVAAQQDTGNCPIAISPDETLGKTILCDQIEVPENWGLPDGRSIDLSYIVLKSTSLAPFSDPVIYFQGGPGGSALNSLALIGTGTETLRANRDIIVVEQRGTAHSNDLFCPLSVRVPSPDTYDADIAAADARIDALEIDAYSDPSAVYEVIAAYAEVKDYRSCVTYLEDLGNDLTQYNTANTVRDVLRLMQHLDYPAYNLFGGSYGTTVALAIMDHYALSAGADLPPLRSVVIDGVAPRNKEFYEEAFITPRNVLRVLSDCEADAACAAAYPDIRQRALDLFAKVQAEPLPRENGEDITLADLRQVLRSTVTNQQKLVRYLPRLIAELERRETADFDMAEAAIAYRITLPDVTMQAESPPETLGIRGLQAKLDDITGKLDALKESLATVLLSNGIIQEAILNASTRPDLFLAIYDKYLEVGGGSLGNIAVSKLEPYTLHPEQRTREGLFAFVEASVPFPTLQAELKALADGLTDEEIRMVFWQMSTRSFQRGLPALDTITHRIVRCNDEGRGFFNDIAFDAYKAFEAPQLIDEWAYWVANYQVSCEQLGLAAETYAPPPPPVVCDVPTPVVNGGLDGATPADWGELAAETLTRVKVATIPMAGHVAGLMTDCGHALVQAFILSPDVPLNRSCIEAARPHFVLPGDDLPTGS